MKPRAEDTRRFPIHRDDGGGTIPYALAVKAYDQFATRAGRPTFSTIEQLARCGGWGKAELDDLLGDSWREHYQP
jgi:hypothetical protein